MAAKPHQYSRPNDRWEFLAFHGLWADGIENMGRQIRIKARICVAFQSSFVLRGFYDRQRAVDSFHMFTASKLHLPPSYIVQKWIRLVARQNSVKIKLNFIKVSVIVLKATSNYVTIVIEAYFCSAISAIDASNICKSCVSFIDILQNRIQEPLRSTSCDLMRSIFLLNVRTFWQGRTAQAKNGS